MVPLSAQGMDVAAIAKVAFTSEDRVRDVIRNFNADGFDSLYPRYRAAARRSSPFPQRRRSRRSPSRSRPRTVPAAFAAWSLSKLAEFLVAEGALSSPRTQPPIDCDLGRGVR